MSGECVLDDPHRPCGEKGESGSTSLPAIGKRIHGLFFSSAPTGVLQLTWWERRALWRWYGFLLVSGIGVGAFGAGLVFQPAGLASGLVLLAFAFALGAFSVKRVVDTVL